MNVKDFYKILNDSGFGPYTGVPCSVFKPMINYLNDEHENEHYICSSEGESLGIAAGFSLSGKIPIVYMQNDGYGNAVNPLSSLQLMYKLPTLLLISWRAKPGMKDAPQHHIMGNTIKSLLELFNIPYSIINKDINLNDCIKKSREYIDNKLLPYAFIVEKGYMDKYDCEKNTINKGKFSREIYFKVINKYISDKTILLGTTGFSGREMYQYFNEHKAKLYMMGSMGCLPSIGLGIAEQNKNKTVFVFDGDGALLMKMGSLSTIGYYKPQNLVHFCFDNNEYESTGGQKTTSSTINFADIAKSCGYCSTIKLENPDKMNIILSELDKYKKPMFIQIQVKPGVPNGLPRPSKTPENMKNDIMECLK